MQRRKHDIGTLGREERQESGVGVAQHHPVTGGRERIGDSPA